MLILCKLIFDKIICWFGMSESFLIQILNCHIQVAGVFIHVSGERVQHLTISTCTHMKT